MPRGELLTPICIARPTSPVRQGLESADVTGWQSFDIAGGAYTATSVEIIMQGTGSGAPGFKMLDARVIGDVVDNPTDTFYVSKERAPGCKFSSLIA